MRERGILVGLDDFGMLLLVVFFIILFFGRFFLLSLLLLFSSEVDWLSLYYYVSFRIGYSFGSV